MTGRGTRWPVRFATPDDLPFLRAMLYEAAYWRGGRERTLRDEALADQHLSKYLDGWQRVGDTGVIALGRNEAPLGAAWYRLFAVDSPGYGFLDGATPEISIAVLPAYRGMGMGSALLDALLAAAHTSGCAALSLSVEPANP